MKVLVVNGSPRRGKNCDSIVEYCKEKLEDCESVVANFKPCIACGHCNDNYSCSIQDGFNDINLEKYDAFIFVSPVYLGSISAQMKAFLDRSVMYRRNGFKLKGKICAGITIGGSRNGGQEFSLQTIHNAGMIHGMLIVGDSNHFGGTCAAPFEKDDFGKGTVDGLIGTLKSL